MSMKRRQVCHQYTLVVALFLLICLISNLNHSHATFPQTKIAFFYPASGSTESDAMDYFPMINYMTPIIQTTWPTANLSVDIYKTQGTSLDTLAVLISLQTNPVPTILPNTTLQRWSSTIIPELTSSQRPMVEMKAMLGDVTSDPSQVMGWLANYYKIPHVLTVARAPSFSDTVEYPYTYRAYLGDAQTGMKVIQYLQENKWKRFALVVSNEAQGLEFGRWVLQSVDSNTYSFDIYYISIDQKATFSQQIQSYLTDIQNKDYRITILQLDAPYAQQIMNGAQIRGMTGPASNRVWIGFQMCSSLLQTVPKSSWPMLYGTSCISMMTPNGNVKWTDLVYKFNASTSQYGVPSQLLGAANSLETVAAATHSLNTQSRPITGMNLFDQIGLLDESGTYNRLKYIDRNLEVGIEFTNLRALADDGAIYYETARTSNISSTTWTYKNDILFYDGTTNIPADRVYTYADAELVYSSVKETGIVVGAIFSLVACTAGQVSLMGYINLKLHLLQRVPKPSVQQQLILLAPWIGMTAFCMGTGFAVMQLCITGFANEYKYFVSPLQLAGAVIAPIIICIWALLLLGSQLLPDMHIIGKNGSRSERSGTDAPFSQTNFSLKMVSEDEETKSKRNNDAARKKERRAQERANRSFCVWLAKDLNYTYSMTNFAMISGSLLLTMAIVAPSEILVGPIRSPTDLIVNTTAIELEIFITSLVVNYFVMKLVFDRQMIWRIIATFTFVAISALVRVLAQNINYKFYWNNDKENSWADPSDAVSSDEILTLAFCLAGGCASILVGLLVERFKLSRDTLDAMLQNTQMTMKKLEEEVNKEKAERIELTRRCGDMKRIMELLISSRPILREYAVAFATASTGKPTMKSSSGNQSNAKHKTHNSNNSSFGPTTILRNHASMRLEETILRSNINASMNLFYTRSNILDNTIGSPRMERESTIVSGGVVPFALFSLSANCAHLSENMSFIEPKNELHMLQLVEEMAAMIHREDYANKGGILPPESTAAKIPANGINDITLVDLLIHPVGFDIFRDKVFSSNLDGCPVELVSLWLDIKYYRMLSDDVLRRTIAKGIFEAYFAEDAPYQIPALKTVRTKIQTTLYSGASALYDSAENLVLETLAPAFEWFKSTFEFKFCGLLLHHPSAIYGRLRQLLENPINSKHQTSSSHYNTSLMEMAKRIQDSPYFPHRALLPKLAVHRQDKPASPSPR